MGCGGLLVLLVLAGIVAAIGGGDSEPASELNEAAVAETAEEPPEEALPPEETPPEETTAAPSPPPRTYKEKIVANLAEAARENDEVLVETAEDGCKSVTFNYKTPFVGSTIPSEPSSYFEAVYGDEELRGRT